MWFSQYQYRTERCGFNRSYSETICVHFLFDIQGKWNWVKWNILWHGHSISLSFQRETVCLSIFVPHGKKRIRKYCEIYFSQIFMKFCFVSPLLCAPSPNWSHFSLVGCLLFCFLVFAFLFFGVCFVLSFWCLLFLSFWCLLFEFFMSAFLSFWCLLQKMETVSIDFSPFIFKSTQSCEMSILLHWVKSQRANLSQEKHDDFGVVDNYMKLGYFLHGKLAFRHVRDILQLWILQKICDSNGRELTGEHQQSFCQKSQKAKSTFVS